jgi:nitroreductase
MELAVMGVRKDYHRKGFGRRLFEAAKDYAAREGYSFIQVKTVRSGVYEDYDITNEFYKSLGFKELEVLEEYWDAANPCQIYVMSLKSAIGTITTRHSYRGKFSSDPVPREDLITIASAGISAPSGCNKQTTDLVIVDDAELLDKIKGLIDPPVAQTAPAMIVVLTRRINAYRDRCFAVQDYSAAIENMLLAIVELGYQSCWYEGHITDDDRICDKIAAELGFPDEYDVVCILPVGKALDDFHAPSKRSFSERVRFNGFN